MLLHRGQFAFLAAVLVGAYGVDRGLTALCAATAAYYATRCVGVGGGGARALDGARD
jgi:hypothetical protein|tara:strand:+ start:659 stop:829 length:171 start_codon:yes stop_codon:yes gene_type:complete